MTTQTSPPAPGPPDLNALPADTTVDAEIVAAVLACSVRHVHRMVAAKQLPAPLRIGQLNRWHVGTLRNWIRGVSERGEAINAV
jgi:predicted DNA-binding transcriptional regulator AlpA